MRTRGDIEEEIQEILENQGILLQEIDWNQENREWENYARFVQEIQEFQENYARLVQEILDNAARSVQETQEILMRFIASIMVWVSLLATLGLLGLAAAYSWVKYSAFRDGEVTVTAPGDGDSVTNTFDAYLQLKDTWLALFIISTIFLVVIALITLFLRERLLLEIQENLENCERLFLETQENFENYGRLLQEIQEISQQLAQAQDRLWQQQFP